jgi:hypothetical protein
MIRIAICDDEEAICSMLEEDIRIACNVVEGKL